MPKSKFQSILYAAAILFILLVTACSPSERLSGPPDLTAEAGTADSSVELPTRLTTYNWGGVMTYGGPAEALEGEAGVEVDAGSEIRISFSDTEPDQLTVQQITATAPPAEVESEGGRFAVPDEPGDYVYGIHGEWTEGSALYGVKITVAAEIFPE